ncbi:MAG TPA: hypothetical protein EYQ69_07390 [Gemmatimonadetes bacterium]|nr:hypothetical protein [Gemmatimonadota bacterium]
MQLITVRVVRQIFNRFPDSLLLFLRKNIGSSAACIRIVFEQIREYAGRVIPDLVSPAVGYSETYRRARRPTLHPARLIVSSLFLPVSANDAFDTLNQWHILAKMVYWKVAVSIRVGTVLRPGYDIPIIVGYKRNVVLLGPGNSWGRISPIYAEGTLRQKGNVFLFWSF